MKRAEEKEWIYEFSRRLKERMEYLEMSQTELAKRSGVPQSSISQYVNGRKKPSAYVIPKLAKALVCSVADLIDF